MDSWEKRERKHDHQGNKVGNEQAAERMQGLRPWIYHSGERTLFHTHRFPVTVYILEGAFRLELEGREPITVRTGQAKMMPPNVKMTGYNNSSTDPLRLVVFYVSDPGMPFLDPIH